MKILISGWWFQTLWKISQWGWLYPIYGNIKYVPNHPDIYSNHLKSLNRQFMGWSLPLALVSQQPSLVLPLDEHIPEQFPPWFKFFQVFCLLTMSHYVTLCHYLGKIGMIGMISMMMSVKSPRQWLSMPSQRLSDVGIPHDDGKVGVHVDGRYVGVQQRVYERPPGSFFDP